LAGDGETLLRVHELLAKLREAVAKLTVACTNPNEDRDKAA
jgi:hypothetical protein